MGAPRLLEKKAIHAGLETQKLQQIKEGVNLAKKVDTLRATRDEEEKRLEAFRRETIIRIQKEIDSKIAERESLIKDNEKLKEDRIRLNAPIDLKEEWEKVNSSRSENETWQSRLIDQQVALLAKEADTQSLSDVLLKRDSELKEKINLAERTLAEAEKKFEEVSILLDETKMKSKTILKRSSEKEKDVLIREQEVTIWDEDLRRFEKELKEKETDISNREIALKARYEALLKAQKYLAEKK